MRRAHTSFMRQRGCSLMPLPAGSRVIAVWTEDGWSGVHEFDAIAMLATTFSRYTINAKMASFPASMRAAHHAGWTEDHEFQPAAIDIVVNSRPCDEFTGPAAWSDLIGGLLSYDAWRLFLAPPEEHQLRELLQTAETNGNWRRARERDTPKGTEDPTNA